MEELFKKFFSDINPCDYVNYGLGAFGAIGVIYTIVSYYQSRRRQKPKYKTITSLFQRDMIKDSSIEIRHSGAIIQDFAITKVAIWNAGSSITREDVAPKDPLHITANNDTVILEAQLQYAEKQNNVEWHLSDDRKEITISFDYFARHEGLVLKVFHTGTASNSLSIGCSLKSGRNLSKSEWGVQRFINLLSSRISLQNIQRIYGWLMILVCVVSCLEAYLSYKGLISFRSWSLVSLLLQLFLYIILGVYIYRTLISSRLPKKIYKYFYSE